MTLPVNLRAFPRQRRGKALLLCERPIHGSPVTEVAAEAEKAAEISGNPAKIRRPWLFDRQELLQRVRQDFARPPGELPGPVSTVK